MAPAAPAFRMGDIAGIVACAGELARASCGHSLMTAGACAGRYGWPRATTFHEEIAMATHSGTSGHAQGATGTSGGMRMSGRQGLVSDDAYNMVSVLYHTLQGCETYQKYLDDAQSAGNQEITQFLQETIQEMQRRSQRGQRLLMQFLQHEQGGGQQMHSQGSAQGQHMAGGSQGSQLQGGQSSGQQGQSGGQQGQSGMSGSQQGVSGSSGSQQQGSGASGGQRSSGSSNPSQGSEQGSSRSKSSR
jgi:hypothetical protein